MHGEKTTFSAQPDRVKWDKLCDGVVQRQLGWAALALKGEPRADRYGAGRFFGRLDGSRIPFDGRSEIGNVIKALIYGPADLDDLFKRDHNVFSIDIAVITSFDASQFSA